MGESVNKENVKFEEQKTRRKKIAPEKKNKGKHNKRKIRVLIYIILGLFVLSLLFLSCFGIYKLSTSTKYKIESIVFEGCEKYSEDELKNVVEIEDGTNLFRISKRDIKKKLETLPYIKNVRVSKKYPNTIKIKIDEYYPYFFAYNKETNKYIKLTKDGIILEECESAARNEELIVFGINFNNNPGEQISEIEFAKLSTYLTIKEKYDLIGIDKVITSVEFKENNIILTLNHDIDVLMNMDDLSYKLNFLKEILNELTNEAGMIDMTIDNPIFRDNLN